MSLARTCRACGKVASRERPLTKCPKCKTPYGPLVFGLDHRPGPPPALTEREKREMMDILRKPSAGGTDA